MKHIQCEMPSLRQVLVRRPGMKSLAVDVFTPLPVPETQEEKATLGDRFVPFALAQTLVETGKGSWAWVLSEGETPPVPILARAIPDDFPHAAGLRAAGFETLDAIPTSSETLSKIPWLGSKRGTERATKSERLAAAGQILNRIDALTGAGRGE